MMGLILERSIGASHSSLPSQRLSSPLLPPPFSAATPTCSSSNSKNTNCNLSILISRRRRRRSSRRRDQQTLRVSSLSHSTTSMSRNCTSEQQGAASVPKWLERRERELTKRLNNLAMVLSEEEGNEEVPDIPDDAAETWTEEMVREYYRNGGKLPEEQLEE